MPPPCVRCGTDRGEPVRGCDRCQMRDQHRHLILRSRFDETHGEAVICEPCLTTLGWGRKTLMSALVGMEAHT